MAQDQERVDQFGSEIAQMHLSGSNSSRDRTLLRLGSTLMVLGVIVALLAYPISHGTTNALQQRDAIVIAVIGLAIAVVGCALFVRYSFAQFLRFWMARFAWEQSTATERLAAAIREED